MTSEIMERVIGLEKEVWKINNRLLDLTAEEQIPEPNTINEWKELALVWISGGWEHLQWFDTSEEADHGWYDFTDTDAFYPYDERLVIRIKK
ncbi:hypothetical protein AV947_gp28 [Podophage Lau218]|uniref:Putative phage protein n=2 Tax=Lauvirus lau218 TaxID=1465639 RepID=A0A060BRR1_9CAUD|nr:hypothetical protein AV947_gp28 [Podophage Lau218]AIA83143.1 putative phage protein [Podophage Lau218]AIA83191.1 putative phage protein [Lauvirus lau218]AIA83241.1 putative phage protein [Lauvirus lau218]